MKEKNKNYLIKTYCRQCFAAVPSNAHSCPLCGISRPDFERLNPLEKEYLKTQPMVPGKYHEMINTVSPKETLGKNIAGEIRNYLGNFSIAWTFYLAFILTIAGGSMLMANVLFPLSFMMLWAGIVYLGYDSINFSRAVVTSYLVKRLQHKTGMSPYSVHFRIENQIEKMLQSLQMVINSFFDHLDAGATNQSNTTIESFISAAETITNQLIRNAELSLNTATIIWRNNVYAIVAKDTDAQEKAIAIGNKIKEAEALIFRYRWLLKMPQIVRLLKDYAEGKTSEDSDKNKSYRQVVLDKFFLSDYGPMTEEFYGTFEQVPYELPFKMRFFWHQQLPPFPVDSEEMEKELPETAELFESINQVRKLKTKLEEQMVLDCVTNAVSEVTALDKKDKAALEARDLKRFQLYSQFLDIPKFQPDSEELQNEVDRLKAEIRVKLG